MSSPLDRPPEFLIDRSLGLGQSLAEAVRAEGYEVHTLRSFYLGEQWAQLVYDHEWVEAIGQRGWLALTKDDRVRREPLVRAAMVQFSAKVFCLANGNLSGAEGARRFLINLDRIIKQGRVPGPYLYGVYPSGIGRLWP